MHTTYTAAAAAVTALANLAALHAAGTPVTRAQAYAMRHGARRKAYVLRRLRKAGKAHYLNRAIATVRAHSMAQFAAAQRYGYNW